jgi:hypothetical protein
MKPKKAWKHTAFVLAFICLVGCASTERCSKSLGSNVSGGISRKVEVYSYSGQLLRTYSGIIDIQENDAGSKVLFDLNGKRIVIYNAIVVAEEK